MFLKYLLSNLKSDNNDIKAYKKNKIDKSHNNLEVVTLKIFNWRNNSHTDIEAMEITKIIGAFLFI